MRRICMAFTEEERRRWHEEKAQREFRLQAPFRAKPVATCAHCHQPFGYGEGTITDEAMLCDRCDAD
jgi:hypothetical protein